MYSSTTVTGVSVTSTGWTTINMGSDLASDSILLQCRSAVNVYLAKSDDPGENYFTLKSGTVLEVNTKGIGNPIFYAKSASGTVVLEVVELRKNV